MLTSRTITIAPGDTRFRDTLHEELQRRGISHHLAKVPREKLTHFARGDCIVIPTSDTAKSIDDAKKAINDSSEHMVVAVVVFRRTAFDELKEKARNNKHAFVFWEARPFLDWAEGYSLPYPARKAA